MPLADSLRWPPELTTPPLYKLILRGLSGDPLPAKWLLRPLGAWWLGLIEACQRGDRITGQPGVLRTDLQPDAALPARDRRQCGVYTGMCFAC